VHVVGVGLGGREGYRRVGVDGGVVDVVAAGELLLLLVEVEVGEEELVLATPRRFWRTARKRRIMFPNEPKSI